MTRKELYSQINKLKLQDEVKKLYGDNYTRCSNAQLEAVVMKVTSKKDKKAPAKDVGVAPSGGFAKLVEVLYNKRILLKSEVDAIMKA